MKLIIEETKPEEVEIITETVNGKKSFYITGPFMKAEVVNGNKRRYPLSVMESAVNRYNEVYVKENRAFGELSHPDSPKINLDRVSHLIVSLKRDGNDFIGKAKVLDTPMGQIAQRIMEGGGKLGVSSRGMGSLKEEGGVKVVQDDFHLATAADIVSDPSAPGAFVSGLMEEKEWLMESGVWREETLMEMKQRIEAASRADREYVAMRSFQQLMSKIVNQ